MKLLELIDNQKIIVQLVWGERKIEFFSTVIGKNDTDVFVTPYLHSGQPLQLNVTKDTGVLCNLFTDDPVTNQRISWKNVELTTVVQEGNVVYCLRTYGFNNIAGVDERRLHERVALQITGIAYDGYGDNDGEYVTIRDISDIGISFYAPESFAPKSQLITITFTDNIDNRVFDVKLDCGIMRENKENGQVMMGCKVMGENRDYQLYCLMKRLMSKK